MYQLKKMESSMEKERRVNQFDYKLLYRRNLPHIQVPGATIFVTFRLDGSIPEAVLERWRTEKKLLEMALI